MSCLSFLAPPPPRALYGNVSRHGAQPPNVCGQGSLHEVMKRTATRILDASALIRKLEFLGHRRLPYRMKVQESHVYDGK